MTDTEIKDVGRLLDDMLKDNGISQYRLAAEMAEIRGTHLGSQDQAIRRIRRLGQQPTAEVAADMAQAFNALVPKLRLPEDYFFQSRSTGSLRDAVEEALAKIERLEAEVAALKKAQGKSRAAASKAPRKTQRR